MQIVPMKTVTLSELSEHDGSNPDKPMYLAIRGTVFDVTSGMNCLVLALVCKFLHFHGCALEEQLINKVHTIALQCTKPISTYKRTCKQLHCAWSHACRIIAVGTCVACICGAQ